VLHHPLLAAAAGFVGPVYADLLAAVTNKI
jgi:hypothetical protein